MPTIRLATFNTENLFSRAKVLNKDEVVAADILAKIASLDALLRKATYDATTKKSIAKLANELSEFIEIREDRAKLFTGAGANRRVTAAGRSAWDGEIEFKRAKISEMARENTAKVLKALKADVQLVVEAENRPVLQAFNSELMDSRKFAEVMCIDGNDQRGIDVGLMSRFPVVSTRHHIYDKKGSVPIFSRDCPEYEVDLGGKTLFFLGNHFKSKSGGDPPASRARRKEQSERVAAILGRYNLAQDLVVVAGDLNDTPDSDPIAPLRAVGDLTDVLELQFGADMMKRWTYAFSGTFNQIDYLLVSKPLKNAFVKAGVERRGMFGLSKLTGGAETEFDTVTAKSNSASDHGAVWAEFNLP